MRFPSVPSLIFSSFALLMLVPMAHAQQVHRSIEISPLVTEMEIENTKSYVREMVIRNTNAVPYEISFEAFDVEIDPDTHNVKFLPSESLQNQKKSLASWILPEGETQFVVVPGEKKIFRFQLSSPVGAEPGDYYASLNFYYKPVAQQQNGNVKVRQSIGSLLLLTLNGSGEAAPSSPYVISQLYLDRQQEETLATVDFMNNTLRFVHLKPLVTLKNPEGEIYYQKEGRSKRVFPGENASIIHSFPNVYLESGQDLTLFYSLWDKQGEKKYYEEQVDLESLRLSAGFDWGRWRTWFLYGTGLLLLVTFFCYSRKKCFFKKSSVGKKSARKK